TKKVRLVACVQTMKYLVMGGRVSPALGKIGGILGINPLIEVTDGSVESVGKVRGYKAAHRWMLQYLEKHPASSQYPVVFTHSVNENGRDDMVQALDAAFLNKQYLYCDLGCTVGTHIGPGAIGFAYIEE
ncbi:MAG: DegV family protein, partial [Peptococcaceae bacterium]|nr:DegV family protein [Peptococcaceae bacterium]